MVIGLGLAGVDVPIAKPAGTLKAREVQRYGAVFILEVRWAILVEGRVDAGAEIDRRLPAEVVLCGFAMRSPDVRAAQAAVPVAAEVNPVAVGRERRGIIVPGAAERFHLSRGAPRVAHAVALRHVEVASLDGPDGPRTARAKIQAQAILRDGAALVELGRVHTDEVDRIAPGRGQRSIFESFQSWPKANSPFLLNDVAHGGISFLKRSAMKTTFSCPA